MRHLTLLLASALTAAGGCAPAGAPKTEVVGLWIGKRNPRSQWKRSYVMGHRPGTSVFVRIRRGAKRIVGVDEKAGKLTVFRDDKGTDLTGGKKSSFAPGGGWLGAKDVRHGGNSCVVEIRSGRMPAAGAKELEIAAEIALLCGGAVRTAWARDVPVRKGATIAAGELLMTISRVRRPRDGSSELELTLAGSTNLEAIKSLTFLAPDGRVIKHRRLISPSFDPSAELSVVTPEGEVVGGEKVPAGGGLEYKRFCALYEDVRTVSVKVEYYDGFETVAVPIKLKIGAGM